MTFPTPLPTATTPASPRSVALVGCPEAQSASYREALEGAGCSVCLADAQGKPIESHSSTGATPGCMVLFAGDAPVDGAWLQQLRAACGASADVPVLVIGPGDEMATRLAAHRAGAARYVMGPVAADRLAQLVTDACLEQVQARYRVLLVDDDVHLLTLHAEILRGAGMEVETLAHPMRTLEVLDRFEPDVVVIDVYMPDVDGTEVASVLCARSSEQGRDLPMLFLSSEKDLHRQLSALRTGGDDFLTKPVHAAHLVTAVTARARRARRNNAMHRRLEQEVYERDREHLALNEHAIVSVANADGIITYVNDRFCQISGYHREELLGQNHRVIRSTEHPASFYQGLWQTISAGEVWHGDVCNRRKDGSLYWVASTIVPFMDAGGLPYQYVSIRTDITRIRQVEAKMRQSEERLRRGQLYANIGTWDWNIQTGELFWTERIAALFGYPEGNLETSYENFMEAVHPDDRKAVADAVNACVQDDVPYSIEHRVVWPDGTVRWLSEKGAVVRDESGQATQMLGVVQDVTARVEAERRLRESEERFSFAVEGAGDGVWDWDIVTGVMLLSGNYEPMLGYARGELQPTVEAWVLSVHPDDLTRVKFELETYLAGHSDRYEPELRLRCKDKSYKWILCRGTVVERDSGGRATRMIGIHSDISGRKQAELALVESQNKLRGLFELSPLGIAMTDMQGRYLEFNDAFRRICGYPIDELKALDYWTLTPAKYEAQEQEQIHKLQTTGRYGPYEKEYRRKDGMLVPIRLNGMMIRDQRSEPVIWSIVEDISERRRSEENLALFRRIFDTSDQAVGITDGQGHLMYINRAHERLLGWSSEETLDQHFSQFLDQEGGQRMQEELMPVVLQGQSWSGLLTMRRKDGTVFPAVSHVGAVKDPKGEVQNLFNIFTDFTDELQRRNELASAKDAAERANQAKSEFLASMSHELRTPMNAILGFGQLMEYDETLSEEGQDNVKEILKAGRHLLELINEVLDLARVESGNIDLSLEPVSLDSVVNECLALVGPLAAQREISLIHADGLTVAVRADRTRFKQVLLNLLSNAIKYNRDGGSVRVDVHPVGTDRLRIRVADTGHGIPANRLAELFLPFSRLGAEGGEVEGTGIGLTITRQIVELMGGSVDVESEVGRGSTFWIELPLAEPHAAALMTQDEGRAPMGWAQPASETQHTVLYIEDNPANLKLVAQILGQVPNVRLLTAHTPSLGIELALARKPELVLLDINMPHMDGYQVLQLLKAEVSLRSTPVIAVTANASARDIERGKQAGFADYLTKPLDVGRFMDTVNRFLADASKGSQ